MSRESTEKNRNRWREEGGEWRANNACVYAYFPLVIAMRILSERTQTFWRVVQWLGVIATALLFAGLLAYPDRTLQLFWGVVIPLLPATFLVSPLLWRNVCPIATLNMFGNGRFRRRLLEPASIPRTSLMSICLFGVMVPARHFLFNESGIALVVATLLVLSTALVMGSFYDAKSGFCNTLCPVLPVEKLYGQHPLISIGNPRCTTCRLCTPRGCIDLSPMKSIEKVVSPAHRSHAWLRTPLGFFAAALPGFIAGYFTAAGPSWSDAIPVYLHIGAGALISYAFFAGLIFLFKWKASRALIILGAVSISLYYAFAAPQMASTLGLGSTAMWAIRIGAFLLIGAWFWRASRNGIRIAHERNIFTIGRP